LSSLGGRSSHQIAPAAAQPRGGHRGPGQDLGSRTPLALPVAHKAASAAPPMPAELPVMHPLPLLGRHQHHGLVTMEVPRLRAEAAAIQLRATAIGRAVCSDKAIRSWGSLVSTTGSEQALA
jgi:hypothetical protein